MTVKIAVIGVGLIGPRHCKAVLKEADMSLVCVVDPAPSTPAFANDLGVPAYSDVKTMLESGVQPHGAIICTPNHTHVALAEDLLRSGIHVLVEKPLCVELRGGRDLVALTSHVSSQLLVGHHRRFHPQSAATKKLLQSGSLGAVVAISGIWAMAKPHSYFDVSWRRSAVTGGAIAINLIHEIDLLLYLFGPVDRVFAEETAKQRDLDAEEGAALVFKFASGVVGTFVLCDAVSSPWSFEQGTGENTLIPSTGQDFLRILGTKGSVSVGNMVQWSYGKNEPDWTDPMECEDISVDSGVPFELQLKNFAEVIQGKSTPVCPGKDGLEAVIVAEAVKTSMKTGRPVRIEDVANACNGVN